MKALSLPEQGEGKMLRSAASKVMWVGRATVFLVGLAVVLALVFGVATTAMGANGDFFKVGKSNLASAVSVLTKRGAGPALDLRVGSGPPMQVNSQTKVANLNADELDDKDSSEIGRELWAHVNSDGTLARGNGVQSSGRFSTGYYLSSPTETSLSAATTPLPPMATLARPAPYEAQLTVILRRCSCTLSPAPPVWTYRFTWS